MVRLKHIRAIHVHARDMRLLADQIQEKFAEIAKEYADASLIDVKVVSTRMAVSGILFLDLGREEARPHKSAKGQA